MTIRQTRRRWKILGICFALSFLIGVVASPVLGQLFGRPDRDPASSQRVRVQGSIEPAPGASPSAAPSPVQTVNTPVRSRPAAVTAGQPLARVELLDVGQGDAIVIVSPEGKAVLVDGGTSSVVVDRLKQQDITSLDMVVVTHHHTDHYGGTDDVIRAFGPRFYLATDSSHTTSMYLKLLQEVVDRGMTAIQPSHTQPRQIQLGSVQITVLPQPPLDHKEENNNSIGLRVTYGAGSVLMTGDSEETQIGWWIEHCPELLADCDVLKLAHHGSRNATTPELLDLVRPRLAVASLGSGNSYGHPHSETLALLQSRNIPLLRTDQQGTIVIQSDGQGWSVAGTQLASAGVSTSDAAVERSSVRVEGSVVDASAGTSTGVKLDLNQASADELRQLPGVTPRTAQRIVSGRPYREVSDLQRVPGIGPIQVSELRDYLSVSPR